MDSNDYNFYNIDKSRNLQRKKLDTHADYIDLKWFIYGGLFSMFLYLFLL